MFSLVLAAMMVCQTPDFGSFPAQRLAMSEFSGVAVTRREMPPTAEIEQIECKCGCDRPDCNCEKCDNVKRTAKNAPPDCLCGETCRCGNLLELQRLRLENAKLKSLSLDKRWNFHKFVVGSGKDETFPSAEIGEDPKYYMRDRWGYEWCDKDNENLVRYVNDLNNGVAGHPYYNEIVLKHQPRVKTYSYLPPQTSSFDVGVAVGGCAGGSCSSSRGLFGGFR